MTALPRPVVSHRLGAIAVAIALLTPSAASAAGNPVVRDCTDDGRLSKTYTQKQLSEALKNIPTDVDEYTDCRDVIRRAQLHGAGGSSGGGSSSGGGTGASGGGTSSSGGGGGATANSVDEALKSASAADRSAVDAARSAAPTAPVQVGDQSLTPAQLTKTDLGALSTVPTPLLIVLGLLGVATISGAGSAILSRVRAHRSPTAS